VLFGGLFWSTSTPPALSVVLSFIGGALVQILQLGTGTRHLVTGMRLDLAQLSKTNIEIDKLKLDMEKTLLDIAKAHEELTKLTALVRVPQPDEIVKFTEGELSGRLKQITGQERSFKR
jgi:hypothetical protein